MVKTCRREIDDDFDWQTDVTEVDWKRKHGEVINPHTGEVLAHVVLRPYDFTRRGLKIKMTKWFGQYSSDPEIAEFVLDRITRQDATVHGGDSSWVKLSRTKCD